MAMRMLMITPEVRAQIAAAIDRARATPVPLAVTMAMAVPDIEVLRLTDRKPEAPGRPPSQSLVLPGGFRVSFCFEEQPHGMVRHLSVSVPVPGKFPQPAAVAMIAEEFGFSGFPPEFGKVWMEEFQPGHMCINVAELTTPPPGEVSRQ